MNQRLLTVLLVGAIATSSLVVVMTLFGVPHFGRSETFSDKQTVILHDVSDPSMHAKEQAALELIRLGYEKMVINCAYQAAIEHKSPNVAQKEWHVEFGLGKFDPKKN